MKIYKITLTIILNDRETSNVNLTGKCPYFSDVSRSFLVCNFYSIFQGKLNKTPLFLCILL